jgi:hypothetical protein
MDGHDDEEGMWVEAATQRASPHGVQGASESGCVFGLRSSSDETC